MEPLDRDKKLIYLNEILSEATSDTQDFITDVLHLIDRLPWITSFSILLIIMVTSLLYNNFKPLSDPQEIIVIITLNLPIATVGIASYQQYLALKKKYSRLAEIARELSNL